MRGQHPRAAVLKLQSAFTAHPAGRLFLLSIPALIFGLGSALLYLGFSELAGQFETVLWDEIPSALGVSGESSWWILLMLTLVGVAAGAAIFWLPGHAGPDPATQELVGPPLPLAVLPGLAVAMVLTLAGGVSLGPENPILAINVALTAAIGSRYFARVPPPEWVALGMAGTLGAMFGTPVAAALLLSEAARPAGVKLWDALFPALVAAAVGAIATDLLTDAVFTVPLQPYNGPQLEDLITGSIVGAAAAAFGLLAVYAFPHTHKLFYRAGNPLLRLTLGGFALGVLGAIGGSITLFKGLDQMKELAANVNDYSPAELGLIVVVKLLALLVAATCGFRGGRVFPSVFIGVAMGLLANELVSDVPQALAVSAAVLAMTMVASRDGWLSLFMGVLVGGDMTLLPVLCVVLLPVWLVLTASPGMVVEGASADEAGRAQPGAGSEATGPAQQMRPTLQHEAEIDADSASAGPGAASDADSRRRPGSANSPSEEP